MRTAVLERLEAELRQKEHQAVRLVQKLRRKRQAIAILKRKIKAMKGDPHGPA